IAKIGPPLALAQMKVVQADGLTRCCVSGERQKVVAEPGIPAIDHRRLQPLDDDGISLQEQAQRLAKVPAIGVEIAFGRKLNDVAQQPGREVLRNASHENETAVVVAV